MQSFKLSQPEKEVEEQKTDKKCPECLADIPAAAKKCSHCGTKQKQSVTKVQVFAVFAFLFIFILLLSGGEDTGTTSQVTNNILNRGEEGILNTNENTSDCSGSVLLGVSEEAIKASIDASINNDDFGLTELLFAEQVFMVDNCTPVLKIGSGGTLSSLAEVRILEHETHMLRTGWIPYEFAVQAQ